MGFHFLDVAAVQFLFLSLKGNLWLAALHLDFCFCIWICTSVSSYLDLIVIFYLLCVDSSPVQRNTTVHLDNGEYWSSRAAVYKGKSHRAIFEDSLEKIYRNMYRKASGIVSDQKPHS